MWTQVGCLMTLGAACTLWIYGKDDVDTEQTKLLQK